MEYVYLAMFLQEIGKEINRENMRKVFAALDMEADDAKIRFFIPALSILAAANRKKAGRPEEDTLLKKLERCQKQFEEIGGAMAAADGRAAGREIGQPPAFKACDDNEKAGAAPAPGSGKAEEPGQQAGRALHVIRPEAVLQEEQVHTLLARYVYGVADKGVGIKLETKGLDGAPVYTIPYREICIVVHDCPPEPYKSEDEAVVKEWLFTQQEVLDAVTEKFGVVLPMSFDMIIEGKDGQDPEQTVKEWLEKNYDNFTEKMAALKGRQEYGVQVLMDTEVLGARLIETDEKLKAKKKDIDSKPEGRAYMEKELLKDLLKEKLEEAADQYFREFFGWIRKCVDDVVIGKVKKVGGSKQMLMNLSCLVRKDMIGVLGGELEKIEAFDGISVRFSGPWAPYSFVTPEKGVVRNG